MSDLRKERYIVNAAYVAKSAIDGGLMGIFFPLIIFILIFYVFIILPQRRKEFTTNSGGALEFKTLTFPNNDVGRRRKVEAIALHVNQGWEVVSESITPGKFNGKTACCLAMLFALPCAFCAGSDDGEITVTLKLDTEKLMRQSSMPVQAPVAIQAQEAPKILPVAPKATTYEPIPRLDTEALVKRALLFLEDGEFDNAGCYLEQALNQDAENSRVHFAKLMLERKVHNVEELIEKSTTPLDNEKLFQRALRFADGEYKTQLEFYARASRKKLDQKREIEIEANYQKAIQQLEKSQSPFEFQEVINKFQSLGNYKETSEWIEKAKKSLNEAQEKEEVRKKFILLILGLIVICILGFIGVRSYINRAEQVAQEKARIDAMTAFFEEKPDAEKLIKNVPGYSQNPVLSGLLSYLDYENGKLNYVDLATIIQSKSFSLYDEAISIAENHDTKSAKRFLGDAYTKLASALLKFNSPAESGDKYSQFRMAQIYNAMNDKANAAKWYRTLADNGTPNEKTKIGNIFYKGEDITQDYKQAYELYSQAAASGDAEAQNNIGWFYQRGFYVDKDYKKAFEWYLKAAEQGMAVSQEAVGFSYATGRGVKQDFSQAVNWYMKAANQGREYSQYRLGELYMDGKCVTQNYNTALQWFRKAADKNNAPAMDKIGWFYQNGWGVNQDYNQAMQWYRKAAEQNNSNAQASIGFLYYEGLGVTKDLNTALEWYKKSAAQGNDIAKKQADLIELRLQGEQTRRNVNTSDFPLPAIIAGNKVGVRESSYQSARIKNVLNTGHPVSVSRRDYSSDGEYYYVRTASGTEGWVKSDYLVFKDANLTYHERQNRRVSLPARGYVANLQTSDSKLNVRNIPSVKGSEVKRKIEQGYEVVVSEIFATEDVDWYHVETTPETIDAILELEGVITEDIAEEVLIEGWVSGKYIRIKPRME